MGSGRRSFEGKILDNRWQVTGQDLWNKRWLSLPKPERWPFDKLRTYAPFDKLGTYAPFAKLRTYTPFGKLRARKS